MNFEAVRNFFRSFTKSEADSLAHEHCEDFRARFERNLAESRAGKGIPNSKYGLDKTANEAGFDDGEE